MLQETQAPSRRERKKIETQERLLAAAWQLFREKGFENTTVEEITNAADVAKGTFFNYFPSKEAMLGPLAAWRMERFWEDAGNGLQPDTDSSLARIKTLLRRLSENLFPDGDLARRALSLHFVRRAEWKDAHLRLWRVLVELVQTAQAQGEIRPEADPRFAARLLLTCAFEQTRPRPEGEKIPGVEQLVDMLLEGLAGKEQQSK